MQLLVAPGPAESHKVAAIAPLVPSGSGATVLDVGCRSQELRRVLPADVVYVGLDLQMPAAVLGTAEQIPFRDRSFDTVLALDVLEHVDDIHAAFAEVCRVADRHIILSLPNGFDIKARLAFTRGKHTAKYGLPLSPPSDRHRWLFGLDDARQFVLQRGAGHGYEVILSACLAGRQRARWSFLLRAWPSLLCPTYLVMLRRLGSSGGSPASRVAR